MRDCSSWRGVPSLDSEQDELLRPYVRVEEAGRGVRFGICAHGYVYKDGFHLQLSEFGIRLYRSLKKIASGIKWRAGRAPGLTRGAPPGHDLEGEPLRQTHSRKLVGAPGPSCYSSSSE